MSSNNFESSDGQTDFDSGHEIIRIQNIPKEKNCIRLDVKLNGFKVKAVLDNGSPITKFSMQLMRKKPEIFRAINEAANYNDHNGKAVPLAGEFEVPTIYGRSTKTK